MYLGDIRLGDTIDFKFTTRRFSTGAPFTLAGTPSVACYVGNGTTEITAGITLTVDFDSRTGLNNVRIVATSGNGFATASDIDVVITAGTVDSVSVVGEVVAQFSIEKRSALMPTTAARTLDVSSTGEGGVDWANVGGQSTTVTLSGTTVKTATDVETDTQDIQSRLPAALVSGRIDASVGAYASGLTPLQPTVAGRTLDVSAGGEAGLDWANIGSPTTTQGLTGTTISSSQVVASVSGAVGSVTGAVGSVTGNVGGNVTGSVGSVASGGITSGSFAAGAIDAAAIATDAIGSAELAASAVNEIADQVWDELRSGHVTAGSFGEGVASVQGNVTGSVASVTGAVGSVTGNVGGNVVGSVASVTGAVGSVTGNVGGNVSGSVGSVASGGITAASFAAGAIDASAIAADAIGSSELAASAVNEIADQVWDEVLSGHLAAGSTGAALNAAGSAGDPWATALPGGYSAGQAGFIVGTNLDAAVSSRLATSGYTAPLDAAGTRAAVGLASANLDTQLDALPTASENADAVWDEARAGHTTAGTFGQGVASVQGNVTGSVASVTGAVGSVTGAVGSVTGNVGGNVVGSVASVTGNVGGNVTGSVGSVLGSVGGSVAGNLGGNVTGSVGSLATQAKADVNAEVVDALSVDTYGEPSAALTGTASIQDKLAWLALLARQKVTQTASQQTVGTVGPIATATVSDDGTTFTRDEWT